MVSFFTETFQYLFGGVSLLVYGFQEFNNMKCKSKVHDIHKYMNDDK